MSIETPEELAALQAIGAIVRETLDVLEAATVAGVTTGELDALARDLAVTRHAVSAPAAVYGFPGTVLISVNDEVVHGVPGARRIATGDIVKLDVTLQKDGYVADAARTVLVGETPDVAARLADTARRALDAALAIARAGTKVNEIGRTIESIVRGDGFSVIPELAGHGVGRTIHEPPSVPNHYNRFQRDVLTDGLVITIEPIIAAGKPSIRTDRDGWTIRTKDGSLAAHVEHTLVITAGAPMLLTA
jgi:methionyl aminopeptidase